MFKFIKSFSASEDGAVTIDWVVITAAVMVMAVGLIAMIAAAATDQTTSVGAKLSSMEIQTY